MDLYLLSGNTEVSELWHKIAFKATHFVPGQWRNKSTCEMEKSGSFLSHCWNSKSRGVHRTEKSICNPETHMVFTSLLCWFYSQVVSPMGTLLTSEVNRTEDEDFLREFYGQTCHCLSLMDCGYWNVSLFTLGLCLNSSYSKRSFKQYVQ